MCEVLEVSRSGYYRWLKRPPSARAQANRSLLDWLLARAEALNGTAGYRKLWEDAIEAGFVCSKNRVQRLLQEAGYRARGARKPGARRPSQAIVLPNVLNREFEASAPNRVWVSDITQIRCLDGWLYVAVVLDLFARRVVGWASGPINNAELVQSALKRAWRSRCPEGQRLLFHSDQGVQYTAGPVQRWLASRGVGLSMSRRGDCWDNACAESLFAAAKKEWLRPLGLIGRDEMKREIDYYFGEFYNRIRRHTQAKNLPPAVFEERAAQRST
jgi:putative transposase